MSIDSQVTVSESYLKDLERKLDGLKLLFGLLPAISSALDLDELMPLVMEKAKKIKGFRYIQVMAPCPTGWKSEPADGIELVYLAAGLASGGERAFYLYLGKTF